MVAAGSAAFCTDSVVSTQDADHRAGMKVSVIINLGSGTLCNVDVEELRTQLSSALMEAGHEIVSWHSCSEPVTNALDNALQHEPDCLMVGGGDGSVSAAARVAWSNRKVLAILPGGTMNLYSRTLDLPMNPMDCAIAYRRCRVVNVDIATADEKVFLHQFTVGMHARVVRLRNTMSYGSRYSKVLATIRAFAVTVFNPPRVKVDLLLDGRRLGSRTVSALSITNNLFGAGHIPYADVADGGVLGIYYSDPIKPGAAFKLVLDTMLGVAENNVHLHGEVAREVRLTIVRKRGRSTGVLDGEIISVGKSINFRIHPGSLQLLLPDASCDENQ